MKIACPNCQGESDTVEVTKEIYFGDSMTNIKLAQQKCTCCGLEFFTKQQQEIAENQENEARRAVVAADSFF